MKLIILTIPKGCDKMKYKKDEKARKDKLRNQLFEKMEEASCDKYFIKRTMDCQKEFELNKNSSKD